MTKEQKKLIYVLMLVFPLLINWVGGVLYLIEFKPTSIRLVWLILAFVPFVNFIAFIILLLDSMGVITLNG